jgi:hypothetical protein
LMMVPLQGAGGLGRWNPGRRSRTRLPVGCYDGALSGRGADGANTKHQTAKGTRRPGRQTRPSVVWSEALKPIGRALGSYHRGRERVLVGPQGLSGTAARGPA